jgi:hypothetical protein
MRGLDDVENDLPESKCAFSFSKFLCSYVNVVFFCSIKNKVRNVYGRAYICITISMLNGPSVIKAWNFSLVSILIYCSYKYIIIDTKEIRKYTHEVTIMAR